MTNLLISKNFQFGVVVILIISTLLSIYVICDSKGLRILPKKRDKNLLKTNVSLLTQSSNTPGPNPSDTVKALWTLSFVNSSTYGRLHKTPFDFSAYMRHSHQWLPLEGVIRAF